MQSSHIRLRTRIFSILIVLASWTCPVLADETGEVKALVQQSAFPQALAKADAFLQTHPSEPQMRFFKGLALTGMGKQPEAIEVFSALAKDYPELAEPYNNLAVLYAAMGQYENAFASLEKALRADPAFVTAYENLADLHVKLAREAYVKLLQLDPRNAAARSRQLLLAAATSEPQIPVKPAADVAKDSSKDKQPRETDVAQPGVLAAVEAWAKAWSARNFSAYLDFYAPEFRVPNQEPRQQWERKRREQIENKSRIKVGIERPRISIKDDVATVRFRQAYESDKHSERENKTLVLKRYEDAWKIIEERAGG